MKEEVNVLFKEEQLMSKIREIAEQINRDYEGKEVYQIGRASCRERVSINV